MEPEDEVWGEAGRRAWAESVQQRAADQLSALLAEVTLEASELARAHVEEFRAKIRRLTNGQIDLDASADTLLLEQLHKLDEPRLRSMVEVQVEQLVHACVEMGEPPPPPITVSSLPSGSVNAICAKDPFDGSIHIFADAELLTFIQSLGKLVCSVVALVPVGPSSFAPLRVKAVQIEADPEFKDRVLNLFYAVVFHGRARMSKPWLPDGRAALEAVFLTWAMERFAIAHELAHALDGHLDGDSVAVTHGDSDTLFAQSQEIEADRIAVRLCDHKAITSVFPELEAIAPYVFLSGVALLEACQGLFNATDTGLSLSHPATPERLAMVTTEYLESSPNLPHKLMRLRILFELDRLFEAWRSTLIPVFEAAKAGGLRPKIERTPLRPRSERPAILGS